MNKNKQKSMYGSALADGEKPVPIKDILKWLKEDRKNGWVYTFYTF